MSYSAWHYEIVKQTCFTFFSANGRTFAHERSDVVCRLERATQTANLAARSRRFAAACRSERRALRADGRVLEPCNQGDGNGHFGGTETLTRNNGGTLPVTRRRLDEPSPRTIAAMCRRATAGSNDDAADRQAAVRTQRDGFAASSGGSGNNRAARWPREVAPDRQGMVEARAAASCTGRPCIMRTICRAGRPCIVRMIWWRSVARTKMIGGVARPVCRRGPGRRAVSLFMIYDSNCRGEPWPGISDN